MLAADITAYASAEWERVFGGGAWRADEAWEELDYERPWRPAALRHAVRRLIRRELVERKEG